MRLAGLVVPALVAVLAWFASGALATAGMASGSPRFLGVTRLVAPDVVPIGAEAPDPWGVLVVVTSALALGGLFALVALLVRAGAGVAGFAAAWAAAAVAGTVVAGVPVVVAAAQVALGSPSALPTVDSAAAGAYWGVVWGWIPALAFALLARAAGEQRSREAASREAAAREAASREAASREAASLGATPETSVSGPPPVPTGPTWPTWPTASAPAPDPAAAPAPLSDDDAASTRANAIIGAAVVGLAGLVAFTFIGPVADASWHADLIARYEADARAAEAAALGDGPSVPTPPVPTPPAGAVPIPEIAPGDWQIDPTWCTENQLEFTASRPDAATGHRGMRVTATNVSGAPCTLDGYPDLAFSDPVTNGFEVRVLHGSGMLGEPDAGAVALELAPGGEAEADVTWDAQARTDRAPAGFLHIAAYPGAVRQLVPIESDIAGGEVEVTAWRLPVSAAASE